MDEDVTALSLHSHEPKIIFHETGKQTMADEASQIVVLWV